MMERIGLRRLDFGKSAEIVSLAYLALPVLLFFIGWLKPLIALMAVSVVVLCSLLYVRSSLASEFRPKIEVRKVSLTVALLLMIGWVLASGIGGIAPQTADFTKHDAVLSDLVQRSWPVIYSTPRGDQPLVYYVAWYLPAATVGKVFHSVDVAQYALLAWSIIGIVLVFYWLSRLVGKSSTLLALLFIGFSGLDVIGSLIMQTVDNTYPLITRGSELQWYTGIGNMQYSSNTTSLFWVPQHAIAGWLLAGMLAAIFIERRSRANAGFLGILGILWSPFATIGLLPIFVCLFLTSKDGWRKVFSAQSILAIIILCGIFLPFFKAGSSQKLQTFLNYAYMPISHKRMFMGLVLFIILEFGLYALLLYRYVKTKEAREWFTLFTACVVFLTLLPLLRIGTFNDLVMRASIPSLFILMVLVYRFISSKQPDFTLQRHQLMLSLALGLGLVGPLIELNSHLLSKRVDVNYWHTIGNPSLSKYEEDTIGQYIGRRDSVFYRDLAGN